MLQSTRGSAANLLHDLYWIEHSYVLIMVLKQNVSPFVVNITVSPDLERDLSIIPSSHIYSGRLILLLKFAFAALYCTKTVHFLLETIQVPCLTLPYLPRQLPVNGTFPLETYYTHSYIKRVMHPIKLLWKYGSREFVPEALLKPPVI
jgi:hypothetical protein